MLFGIYGFNFKTSIHCNSYTLIPLPVSNSKVATDSRSFNLTGHMEINTIDTTNKIEELIFEVSSLLTFIQQQYVIITYNPSKNTEFPKKLNILASRTKGGELVNDKSKESLLNLLVNKLSDASFISSTDFRTALFRNIEIWRLNSHFIDITYYFCFSGIEALARCKLNDYDSPAAQVITPFLISTGFEVTQEEMQNYAHVRNALFHYGHHSKIINNNGSRVELKLSDFEDSIMRLFPDILLKIVGFNDDHVNWNRWKDLMAYKKLGYRPDK